MPPGRTLGASVGLSKHDHGRKSQSTLSKHRQDQLSAFLHTILFTQRYFIPLAVLTFLFDAALTNLIICKVPYTEIDWATYLQQAKLFLKGQRNYAEIRGDTGPCVYPAGHLYTYSLLHWTTAGGTNLKLAQYIFAAIYLIGQGAIIEVYRKAGLPSVLLALLPLSKRLHSIYVLRLFNDGVAMTGMWIALALVAHRRLSLAAVMTSLALSVKMNILLFLPGLAVVLYRYKGFWQAAVDGALILAVQILLAVPFLASPHRSAYLAQAFDLSRQFLYKWTVNFRFVPEEVFLDTRFGLSLLALHISLLVLFGSTRWTRLSQDSLAWIKKTWRAGDEAADALVTKEAVLVLLTSNLVGILCARSLHYQFYSWYFQTIPMLVWECWLPLSAKLAIPVLIEFAWNAFPSTSASSIILCTSNALVVVGLYRRPIAGSAPKAKHN